MAKKPKVYTMWALFNYNRPPIFIDTTRREIVAQGVNWVGGEQELRKRRRDGSITIEKVVVRRVDSQTRNP